ncbi:hypothetical protein PENTCL1PPCAC_5353, partial [Pristionchus entomophagus]
LGIIICLGSSFVVSIALHEFAELKLLGASNKMTTGIVVFLYTTTLIVTAFDLNSDSPSFTGDGFNYTEIVFWNSRRTGNIGRGDCQYDIIGKKLAIFICCLGLPLFIQPGNGTARILIIGNSYAGCRQLPETNAQTNCEGNTAVCSSWLSYSD